VVSLPDSASEELLAKEIGAVDGVSVEHIRPVDETRADAATAILEVAARVADTPPDERARRLVDGLLGAFDSDWAVAIGGGQLLQRAGDPPELGWLVAFLDGSEHLDASTASVAPGDVMWARLPRAGIAIAVGRAQRPVHDQERARIDLLARITDALL
jgi:hypothetical protein